MGKEGFLKPTEGQQICHRRTCSDTSFHLEENPSWLEDLLDDTEEVPVRKGHRRSVSFTHANLDGEAYKDLAKEAHNNSVPSWASLDYDQSHEQLTGGLISKNPKSSNSFLSGSPSLKDGIGLQYLKGSSGTIQKADHTVKLDGIPSKPTPPLNPDTKRAKQQANHRPRIRKLQYIAELERHVQFLQIEGLQVTAELEFLDQHNLILVMENRALKHQLDSISQVQHIKCLEQDMLEREIARLRNLYQHQQLQQQKLKQSTRRASKNRDLDFQFAHMSIKYNGIGSL